MERALVWAGYDVNHAWGTGAHDGNQSTQVFPDAPAGSGVIIRRRSSQTRPEVEAEHPEVDPEEPWQP
jgi:hypothetical protein